MSLEQFGWNDFFAKHFQEQAGEGISAGRVAAEHKGAYRLYTEQGELWGELAGRLRHEASAREELPAVGDWVLLRVRPEEGRATLTGILPRRSKFSRKAAGENIEEQIVGANIDTVLLVMGLDGDYNPRRLERYLTLSWESGASPVVVLSKADLCEEVEARREEIEAIAFGVPIHAVSALDGSGLEALGAYLGAGRTVALLGSSGVGKSTITNRLLGGEVQATREVRAHDSRGRHTTTSRSLLLAPGGGLILDTPGMRELSLWQGEESLSDVFADISALAEGCRFRDCSHEAEPGCAVQEAALSGALPEERLSSYRKLERELRHLAIKQDQRAQSAEKQRWKSISKSLRQHYKARG